MPLMSRKQGSTGRSLTSSTATSAADFGESARVPPPVGYGSSRYTSIETSNGGGGIPEASTGRFGHSRMGAFIPPAASAMPPAQNRFSQPITRPLPRAARPLSPVDEGPDESSAFIHHIHLDSNQAGIVIGKGGTSIHRIEHESGAKMRTLPAGPDGERMLEISSTDPGRVEKAVQMVDERLAGFNRPLGESGGSRSQSIRVAATSPIPPRLSSTYDQQSESEPRIIEYVSVPLSSAIEFSPQDLAKLKKELGVRICSLQDGRRLMINGPEGKVVEAKRYFEAIFAEETGVQPAAPASQTEPSQPESPVRTAAATPQTHRDSGNSSDDEVSATSEVAESVGAGGDENDGEETAKGDGSTEAESELVDEEMPRWVNLEPQSAAPPTSTSDRLEQLTQAVEKVTKGIGELKTSPRSGDSMTKEALEALASLRTDVDELKAAKKVPECPLCAVCNARMCQVLASCGEMLICSRRCSMCNM